MLPYCCHWTVHIIHQSHNKINAFAKEKGIIQKILFRIKPGIDAHTHDFVKTGQIDSKFGVALENGEAFEIHKYATTLSNIQVDGVHCHIGSQIFEFEPFCEAAKVMMNFIADLEAKLSLKIKILNTIPLTTLLLLQNISKRQLKQ